MAIAEKIVFTSKSTDKADFKNFIDKGLKSVQEGRVYDAEDVFVMLKNKYQDAIDKKNLEEMK
ncbi:MAG: hypothetical protein FWE25_09505 [Lachnospiraceae bacterium]|nr:hypothetical protein [Lachnospiraceae bacterium]